ncbi:MAG: pyridoxamine 5'-phosphate oxidase [Alphaproteobacteria bacterium]|nr:pyridoxamine 5'-phosphate oxidase [Alphaproteobacteria bacterium SS10]
MSVFTTGDDTRDEGVSAIDIINPFKLFGQWFEDAKENEINDPNAMTIATVDEDGMPSARMVLLKDFDERGFVFYTNHTSRKGRELYDNPATALMFYWKSLRRQVRIEGDAAPVPDAEADAYFASRSRGSRIGAWASLQSQPLESREALKARVEAIEAAYPGEDVPRPPHWSGFRVSPRRIEFWEDMPFRLHNRIVFHAVPTATDDPAAGTVAGWRTERLYP